VNDMWQETLDSVGMLTTVPDLHEKDVFLSRRIEAESSRVFYALSIKHSWLLLCCQRKSDPIQLGDYVSLRLRRDAGRDAAPMRSERMHPWPETQRF
jgi:hypothetical protein